MTSPLFAVLARTLTQSSLAEPAMLESRAHGTVPLRASFIRREVVRDRMDGKVPMMDGEAIASINEADAPEVEIGDMIFVSGKLWKIRAALADGGGLVKLQLVDPELLSANADNVEIQIVVAGASDLGDLEQGEEIAALTKSTALRFRQRRGTGAVTVTVEGDAYRVLAVEAWQGLWRKLTLSRAE